MKEEGGRRVKPGLCVSLLAGQDRGDWGEHFHASTQSQIPQNTTLLILKDVSFV